MTATLTLWVCTDCCFAYHEGDYTKTDDMDCQPWGRYDLSDGTPTMTGRGITSGLMADQHSEDCAFRTSGGQDECTFDGECETRTFSWSWCDACWSKLGGTRHGMTQWLEASS